MNLELQKEEALILFELIKKIQINNFDKAEKQIIWNLECYLEKKLVEPFQDNYKEIFERAKSKFN